jgi:hypothetical protein
MSENPKFKLKYDQLRDGNPAKKLHENAIVNSGVESNNQVYDSPGNTRNLCFSWPDNTRQFLNYTYLVSAKLNIGNEINTITMMFTSHTVSIKGYNLELLFFELNNQIPSSLVQMNPRYCSSVENGDYLIVEILIEQNK